MSKETMNPGKRLFRVGDKVRVRLGLETRIGTIVEDRGYLASGGRRLLRVEVPFDPPNVAVMEVPEEELKPYNEE